MTHFYFHLRTGHELQLDEEGEYFADYPAARRIAESSARELLIDVIKSRREEIPDAFVIADEQGLEIGTVSLRAMLPISLRK